MKKHKQLVQHIEGKQNGDCFRTALACILDLEVLDVPHFYEDMLTEMSEEHAIDFANAVNEWIDRWLMERGVMRLLITLHGQEMSEALGMASGMFPYAMPYLLSGKSENGFSHCVVCKGEEVVWDPAEKPTRLVGPMQDHAWLIEFFVRPATMGDVEVKLAN